MRSRISVVVVHHRTPALLPACLAALDGFDEVVVVDNASGDGTAPWLRSEFPLVSVLESGRNDGFGAGANLGMAATTGDAVLFLNPDAVAGPGLCEQLRADLERHPGMWIGGSRLVAPDGRPQANGRRWYSPASVAARRLFPRARSARRHTIEGWDRTTDRPVDWVAGTGMLVRRTEVEALGGFDGRYFMYFEDVDLCLRVWRAGGQVWFLSRSTVAHGEQRASARGFNRALWWHLRSYGRFLRKWRLRGLRPAPYGDRCAQARSILPRP